MPAADVADAADRVPWSRTTRLAFRFAFSVAVLSLVHLIGLVTNYLYFDTLQAVVGRWLGPVSGAESRAVRYIGATAIRLATGTTGTPEAIAQRYSHALLFLIAVTLVATSLTLLWSLADRRRTEYTALNRWLRVYARYTLALVMLIYAMVKVVPTQFGFLTPGDLLKPVGQLTPFWMLWNFMVTSTAYTIFAGLVELLGCVLLFFRRTTIVGALLLTAALTNVFAMDLAYRVLGAAMVAGLLLVLAAIVLAPATSALVDVFLLGRPGRLPAEPTTWLSSWRYAPLAKGLLLVLLIAARVPHGLAERGTYFGQGRGVYGLFEVVRFVRGGALITPMADDAGTWKRVGTDGRYDSSAVTVQFANSDVRQYRLVEDAATRQWTLRDEGKDVATLTYALDEDGTLSLEGHLGAEPVEMHLRRVDMTTLPLLRVR